MFEPYMCKEHKFITPENTKKFAYCTLLMIDDSYLPGVLTLGFSVRRMGSNIDLIAMCTPDISEDAVKEIKKIYTKVVIVNYIIPLHGIIKTGLVKKYPHYGKTFTKLNMLNLTEYDKVLFLDADSLVLRNFDSVFSLDPPAAVYYGSHKMHENNYKPRLKGDKYRWHEEYCECCDHGKKIDEKKTDVIKNNIYGMSTECMMLKPDKELLKKIINEIHDVKFKNTHKNGFLSDAGYITWKYSGQWTGMDPRFLGRRGYPRIEDVFGVTLGGSKPWLVENVKYALSYPDYKLWYSLFLEMLDKYSISSFNTLKNIINEKTTAKHISIMIILPNTSGGLLHDADIYKLYFKKHLINTTIKIITSETKLTIDKYSDINLFLESIHEDCIQYIFRTKYNIFMINHELFDYDYLMNQIKKQKRDIPEYDYNKKIDLFLCKTMACVEFIKKWNLKYMYTKFTTLMPIINTKKDYNQFLHTAGSSPLKNTDVIINIWNKLNKKITITCYDRCLINLKKYVKLLDNKYINLLDRKQEPEKIIQLCNSIGNHLCPSMIEGYGHYINQGRITSSIVLTIDAPPMNELVNENNGILIPYSKKILRKNGSLAYVISEHDLLHGINKMLSLTDKQREKMGIQLKAEYEKDTIFFDKKMKELCDFFSEL